MKIINKIFKKIVAISLGFTTISPIINIYAGPGDQPTQSAFKSIPEKYIQKISENSKAIKSPVLEDEKAKGERRKPKWDVSSSDNQIIFNGRIENSISSNYIVTISKDDDRNFTIDVVKNGDVIISFKTIGKITGKDAQKVCWCLMNNMSNIVRTNITIFKKYIHFNDYGYSASTDKDGCQFIFCQKCATRCIQKLLGENIEIIKDGVLVSCPIKFQEDYSYRHCLDCDKLNKLNLKSKKAAKK